MQRDLSDSTVRRTFGVALGHSLVAYTNLARGLERIDANEEKLRADLESHWEVIAEGAQTILRAAGIHNAYEQLKFLTRGKSFTQESFLSWVDVARREGSSQDPLASAFAVFVPWDCRTNRGRDHRTVKQEGVTVTVTVVIGTQWGDEGKGKAVDVFAREVDYVARYNGGNNAGHTVVNPRGTFKIHLVPSGMFYPRIKCLIGGGVVIDPRRVDRRNR